MKSPEQILQECQHVEDLISQPCPDDAAILRQYGDELSAWLATMARNVGDGRYIHRKGIMAITRSILSDTALSKMTPMVMNNYIKASAHEYAYVEDMSDRLYSALSKRLEWVRSQLSYNKIELQNLKHEA